VEYPEYLDLRPYMSQITGEPLLYTLYAVLVHSGGNCRAGHYFCYAKVKSNFLPNKGKTCAGEETAVLLATKMLGERRSPYGLDWICFDVLIVLQFFAGFLFRSHAVRLQISLLCRPAMCYGT